MIHERSGVERPRRVALRLLALAGALSCAHAAPVRTLVLNVSNELGRPIGEIQRKACEEPETAFVKLEESHLSVGETRGFVLPPTCVDLIAFDARGRIVGEQRELTMLPGASWVLRR